MQKLLTDIGEKSKKESDGEAKNQLFENEKKTQTYKKILETFSDAELVDIEIIQTVKDFKFNKVVIDFIMHA